MRCSATSAGPAISDLLSLSRGPRCYSLRQSDGENSKTRKRMKGVNKWIKRNKNRLWIRSLGSSPSVDIYESWWQSPAAQASAMLMICRAQLILATKLSLEPKLAMAIGFHIGLEGLAINEVDWFSSPLGVMFCQNSYLFFFRRSINRSSTDSLRKVIVVVVSI